MNSWTWIDIKQGQTVHKRAINIYIERERCRNNINTKRQKCRETKIIGDSEELSYQSLDRSGVYFFFAYNSQKSLSIRNSDIIQVKIFMIHFILSPLYLFFFSYFLLSRIFLLKCFAHIDSLSLFKFKVDLFYFVWAEWGGRWFSVELYKYPLWVGEYFGIKRSSRRVDWTYVPLPSWASVWVQCFMNEVHRAIEVLMDYFSQNSRIFYSNFIPL